MFNFIRKSLMAQFIVLFVSTALGSIAVVGYSSYISSKNALEQQIFRDLTATAKGRETTIQLLLDMRMHEIEFLAANKEE